MSHTRSLESISSSSDLGLQNCAQLLSRCSRLSRNENHGSSRDVADAAGRGCGRALPQHGFRVCAQDHASRRRPRCSGTHGAGGSETSGI